MHIICFFFQLLDDFNQNSELASYSSNFVLKWPMVAKHIIGIAKTKKTELIVQLLESNKNISNNGKALFSPIL